MKRPTYEQLVQHPELIEKSMEEAGQERAQAVAELYAAMCDALSRALRAMTLRLPSINRIRTA